MQETPFTLAARQHGVVTRAQLVRLGVSRAAARHMVTSGGWARVGRSALVRSGSPTTDLQRVLIAVVDVDAFARASHDTAAWLWGLAGFRPSPIHIASSRSNPSTTLVDVRLHKVRALPNGWTTRHLGIPVVRPEMLALHLFHDHPRRGERLTDRLWSEGLLSGRSIAAFLSQLGEHGRNGTAGLRRYLDARGPDYVPPATGLEFRLNEVLADLGVSVRRQVDLGDDQWGGRVDFVCSERSLVIEAHSEKFHLSLSDRTADAARQRKLELAGFTVVEVWDTDVFHRPWIVIKLVRAALQPVL